MRKARAKYPVLGDQVRDGVGFALLRTGHYAGQNSVVRFTTIPHWKGAHRV